MLLRALPILLCLTIPTVGIAVSAAVAKPSDDGAIVAVFPPWWPASRALMAASNVGDVRDSGAFSFVLIVRSQRPGLGDRLKAAGALFLLNPSIVGGCEPVSGNQDV